MRCPNCDVDLLMAERQGVGIDYCPQCRGVWLDRGKLDTILDRGVSQALGDAAPPVRSQGPGNGRDPGEERRGEDRGDRYGDRRHEDEVGRERPQQKKKGGLLGDLMDSFGGG
jgi:Zn-finger nucleic acid-binding protein